MNIREALETRPWFGYLRRDRRDTAVKDIEKGLRAAWEEGTADGRSIDCGYEKSSDNGVTAGATAMVEAGHD